MRLWLVVSAVHSPVDGVIRKRELQCKKSMALCHWQQHISIGPGWKSNFPPLFSKATDFHHSSHPMGGWICMCDFEDFSEVASDIIGCT